MRALVLALLLMAGVGCASAPRRPPEAGCIRTQCGDLCCNDDGKVCPYCPH